MHINKEKSVIFNKCVVWTVVTVFPRLFPYQFFLFYLYENNDTTFFYVSKQGDIMDFQQCVVWTVVTVFSDFYSYHSHVSTAD